MGISLIGSAYRYDRSTGSDFGLTSTRALLTTRGASKMCASSLCSRLLVQGTASRSALCGPGRIKNVRFCVKHLKNGCFHPTPKMSGFVSHPPDGGAASLQERVSSTHLLNGCAPTTTSRMGACCEIPPPEWAMKGYPPLFGCFRSFAGSPLVWGAFLRTPSDPWYGTPARFSGNNAR